MNRKMLLAAVAGAAMMAGTASEAADYKVGVMQSLTGPFAFIGVGVKNGMMLALDELNKAQALGAGNTLVVPFEDDAGDRTQSVTLFRKFAVDSAVLAVVGPTSGAAAPAVAAAANEMKTPLISTVSNVAVLQAGPYGFIMGAPAVVSIPYIGKYAVETLKVKNCVSIGLHDNESYVLLERVFVDYVTKAGVKFVSQEGIKVSDSDFSAVTTKVAAMKDIDCLYVSAPAPQAANLVTQLRAAGLASGVRIIGHNALASPDLVAKGGAAVEGVYLMADFTPGGGSDDGRAFVAAYKARFGSEPDNWAALGYSEMRIAAAIVKAAGPNPTRESVKDVALKVRVPVVTGDGMFFFDEQRLPHYGMAILQVKDGKFVAAPK